MLVQQYIESRDMVDILVSEHGLRDDGFTHGRSSFGQSHGRELLQSRFVCLISIKCFIIFQLHFYNFSTFARNRHLYIVILCYNELFSSIDDRTVRNRYFI